MWSWWGWRYIPSCRHACVWNGVVSVGVFAGGTVAVVVVVWRVRIRVSSVAAVPLHAIKVSKMLKF